MKRHSVLILVLVSVLQSVWPLPAGRGAPPFDTPANNSSASANLAKRIRRIETGFPPDRVSEDGSPPQWTMEDILALYNVPGLSLAVIDDFKIAWAKGYGIAEAGGNTPVTPRTMFQAGSVSKLVAATGALALVEQGTLRLDEDVNASLKSWKVPESEFTKQEKVTLRRILSHTAGLTVHFYPGYATGTPLPSLIQILNGQPPGNTAPVVVKIEPGSKWRYSGGGYVVAQLLMIDTTGKPFPELMRETVFDKLATKDSTYEQPLPANRAGQAASGTFRNGKVVPGKWHVYPEMAAAGLWTTPSDLATLAIEIALAKQGKSTRVLSQAMARQMLKPQVERTSEAAFGNRQHPDGMGLGVALGDSGRSGWFGHIGDDAGFQAMLLLNADSGQGVAVMANSENGILLGDYLTENVASEYGWKDHVLPTRPRFGADVVLKAVARSRGAEAAMKAYRELKKGLLPRWVPDRETLIKLTYWLKSKQRPSDALQVAKLAVEENPKYWYAYDTLAEMYLASGDTKLAIEGYEKSISLNPGNETAKGALQRLKGKAGE